MYGHPGLSTPRFTWVLDDEPVPQTEMDRELWCRYVDLRGDMEIALESLGMIRNWLGAKLDQINYQKDDNVMVMGWEMMNAISHLEVGGNQLRELARTHLTEPRWK